MRIGDEVQISHMRAGNQKGMYGRITKLRVTGIFSAEWYVKLEDGTEYSWLESSMELVTTEYHLALQVLGEDYFA